MKNSLPALLLFLALAAFGLARNSSAMIIPLTPCADYFPDNPMVHQKGTVLVNGTGNPLRLRGVTLGGWLISSTGKTRNPYTWVETDKSPSSPDLHGLMLIFAFVRSTMSTTQFGSTRLLFSYGG